MAAAPRVALVSGGNRGIGFAICRQLAREGVTVVLTSRDTSTGKTAVKELHDAGLAVELGVAIVALDHAKACDPPAQLGNRDFATLYQRKRKLDCVRICLEMRPVRGIGQRRAPLEVLECLSFEWFRGPEADLSAL